MNESDELIYGRNSVLAYLEQAQGNSIDDFKLLQGALTDEANISTSTEHVGVEVNLEGELLTKELQNALANLKKKKKIEIGLPMSEIKQLMAGPSVKVNKILLAQGSENDSRISKIKALAKAQKIPIQSCDRRKLDQIAGPNRRHQGVVAVISPSEIWSLDTFLQKLALDRLSLELRGKNMDGYMVVILDGIEDPHNLGAIIRAAEASGVKALFIPQRRSAGLTGTVAKTSAGALANLPVVRVSNVVHAIETLKKYDFWVVALDAEADMTYTECDFKRPLVIVIGAEGKGIGRLVKEHCDLFVKIPMLGKTESLNASVAAGVLFYEVVRQSQS